VQRLDTVIEDVLDIAPGAALFLKIDAQGFDLDVLRGTAKCMDRIVLLQLELSARAVYELPPALGDAINEVMTLGFDPIGFFPVVRGEGFRVIEFDGLFRRTS
jgi:Methyltransferase FkbM domain